MFVLGVLYVFFLLLVLCFVIAWLMMPFELRAVNRNLKEIKELLLRQNSGARKSRKTQGDGEI